MEVLYIIRICMYGVHGDTYMVVHGYTHAGDRRQAVKVRLPVHPAKTN